MPASPVSPRRQRVANYGSQTHVAPPLDRSGSSSSLESDSSSEPQTPTYSASPSPVPYNAAQAKQHRSAYHATIARPQAVYEPPVHNLPRSLTSAALAKQAVVPEYVATAVAPSKEGFFNRLLRSDRRKRAPAPAVVQPSMYEYDEYAVASAMSWHAVS